MKNTKILIIDDQVSIAGIAKLNIEELGKYEVKIESDPTQALDTVSRFRPDLILLDLNMPQVSGLELCKKLKGKDKFSSIPIIVLSGYKDENNKVLALNSGADDYIVKPFSLSELDARMGAVLRRGDNKAPERENEIIVGDLIVINIERHKVFVKAAEIELTPTEFTILKTFASHPGHIFSRVQILDHLWESPESVTERTVDVHIKHLRDKLGAEAAELIKNVRGVGYKLE